MRNVHPVTVMMTAILLFSEPGLLEGRTITLCSFRISKLGASSENKDHGAVADIIDEFDLTVVQEVQDNGGENHVKAIVDSMNAGALDRFSYFIVPRAGRGFPGYEGYAFIYRNPVELDGRYAAPYGLKETDVDYGRKPGWACFRAGDFDFMVAGIHLHRSNLDTRAAEVADLLSWLKEFAEKPQSEERDLIIVGDTNRFADYSNKKFRNRETAFHRLLDDPALGDAYRLPFCEHLLSDTDVRIFTHTLEEDTVATSAGDLKITYVGHASLFFTINDRVIHVDPCGSLTDYSQLPKADMIFVTHEHSDHLDTTAIGEIRTESSVVVCTEKCAERLAGAVVMKNGDTRTVEGIEVEAVPAYNIVHTRGSGEPYHPKGAGNGYIFTFGDTRVYVAGDTENTPEMKALEDIDLAFLPMDLPYTMTPEMAADAAMSFKPKILYPYHYGDTDTSILPDILNAQQMDSKEAYTDAGSTTVSDDNNMVFDQVIISQGAFFEFGEAKAVLDTNIGIVDYDSALEEAGMDLATIEDLISNHRPIYITFSIDEGDDDGIPALVEEKINPHGMKLYDNHPNPFNSVTTIRYYLPSEAAVNLSIFNSAGQVVAVLSNGARTAGDHSVQWDASGLPSGMYFYTLKTRQYRVINKLMLLK